METLKLHADGVNAHFKAVKEKFEKLHEKIRHDEQLSDVEKTSKLKDVKTWFLAEKKLLQDKLF